MTIQMKHRTSGAKRRRRSHHALKKTILGKCPKCGKTVRPHVACAFCGEYKGRAAVKVKAKKAKVKKTT
jgi:large subunit ribosomal protein L32